MLDAHVHLDFMSNGEEVARDAAAAECTLYAATVTPAGFDAALERFAGFDNVIVGLGLHPWWVGGAPDEDAERGPMATRPSDARLLEEALHQADALIDRLDKTWLVSEVGLDFGKRHARTRDAQLAAFGRMARACAECGGKTLSLHAVHAAREVMDVLEHAGTLQTCTCIFHWYSGPSDQLKRAIQLGFKFSVGERMLNTKRGREYRKVIPPDRLLLETDAPPEQGQPYTFAEVRDSLQRAESLLHGVN